MYNIEKRGLFCLIIIFSLVIMYCIYIKTRRVSLYCTVKSLLIIPAGSPEVPATVKFGSISHLSACLLI